MSEQAPQIGRHKFRPLPGPLARLVNGMFAAITLLGCMWAAGVHDWLGLVLFTQQYLATVLGIGLTVCFLAVKARKGEADDRGVPWYDWLAAATCILVTGYIAVRYPVLVNDLGSRPPERWILGILTIAVIFEATRRTVGTVLVWLAVAGILYTTFSHLLPGDFYAPSSEWDEIAAYLYLDGNGIVGLPIRVFSTIIITFILFGQTLYALKGDQILNDLAISLMGRYRGGPAKVAVAGSSLFGTISGSVVSNVMMDGPVTIPMMVRAGYSRHMAAAIEAVASNGGQIAPPVMGATAFIIAEFLEMAYIDVVIAAALPAILYYLVLFLQVDAIAARFGLSGLPRSELPKALGVLYSGWIFVIPLVVLMYFLFGLGYNPGLSAMYACVALLVLGILKKRRLPNRAEWKSFVFGGGENLLPLILIGGAAGVVMGVLNSTGLAFQLSIILTDIGKAAGIFVMLLLTAFISIILGMGMPTAAIYIILATVIAPALVDMGLVPIAAHLFLFYFGLLSMLTPPVAVASMVAAGLAGSDMWRTGLVGMQLATAAYLLPFVWVFNPALILIGSWQAILYVIMTTVVAGFLIAQVMVSLGTEGAMHKGLAALYAVAMLAIGSATIWIGPESPLTLLAAAAGIGILVIARRNDKASGQMVAAK